MADQAPTLESLQPKRGASSRRTQTRSVWGCLTCRRRRVKCRDKDVPCQACRRLCITCTPSFSSNFKQWRTRAPATSGIFPEQGPEGHGRSRLTSHASGSVVDEEVVRLSPRDDDSNDINVMAPHVSFETMLLPEPDFSPFDDMINRSSFYNMDSFTDPGGILAIPSDGDAAFSLRSLSPFQEPDTALVNHYKHHLSSFFSIKSTTSTSWNFYTYALLSTENSPDSPLRHSILAWASAHLVFKNRDASSYKESMHQHYYLAQSAADSMLAELTETSQSSRSVQFSYKRLETFLSTCLFLSYCDMVTEDIAALANRLATIRRYLSSHWDALRERMGSLESRILVWLAYLDLRSNFWVVTMPGMSRGNSERGQLFDFLMRKKGISSLRATRHGNPYYLTECFGSSYPEEELKEDMLQEPTKLLSDDTLCIFSKVLEFGMWDDETRSRISNHSELIEELRTAKIQAIRADIARVRAENKVIQAQLKQAYPGDDCEARTELGCLANKAKHLTATILLNRAESPEVRTDDEAQEAAREIVVITRQLEQLGFSAPRTLIWPIPVFVAGLEVTDEIYQDWILNYMDKLATYGYSTRNATKLLRNIMELQERTGKRAKIRDVGEASGHVFERSHVLI